MWKIIRDQIKEKTAVVVVVVSKSSEMWRRTRMKSVIQEEQLKYVDAKEMRVITNSERVAEQIKKDTDKCVAMDDRKFSDSG